MSAMSLTKIWASGKFDDDFDIVGLPLQRPGPMFGGLSPRDHHIEPASVSFAQCFTRHLIVKFVGVDRSEQGVVVEHHRTVERSDINFEVVTRLGDAHQTSDAARRRVAEHIAHDAGRATAFDQYVRLETKISQRTDVIDTAKPADHLALGAMFVMIENMNLEPALRAHERRQEPDRAGPGYQQRFWIPGARALADPLGMIPGFRHHTRRFEQNAGLAERGIDLDQKFRLDTKILRAESMTFLDAALGVAAVAAHIPFAYGA